MASFGINLWRKLPLPAQCVVISEVPIIGTMWGMRPVSRLPGSPWLWSAGYIAGGLFLLAAEQLLRLRTWDEEAWEERRQKKRLAGPPFGSLTRRFKSAGR